MMHVQLTEELLRTRARELIVYLRFLRVALENDASVSARAGNLQLPLDKALTHMMKANVCLLLYSAMEASLVQLLDEMHLTIGQNCQGTDQLNAQLLLVVARHFKASRRDLTRANTTAPIHESLFKVWLDDWQDRDQRRKREGGVSGSVDSLTIFKQLNRFGMFSPDATKPPAHLTHKALQSTKSRRNQLAHGERSFAELGQDLAFEELRRDAIAIFRTLKSITVEVNTFLEQRRYLAERALIPIEA
jgi:hypothetical protein